METMMFFTCWDMGVTRAVYDQGSGWLVEKSAVNHKVNCLISVPGKANHLYAGTDNGLIQSTDCGESWHPCGLNGKIIKSLAVSPHDHRIIFAGTKPAYMFKSQDGGQTWTELTGFRDIPNRWWWMSPAESPWKAYVLSITLSPEDPDIVLAGIEFGAVVRSEDGGRTWSAHRRGAARDNHSLKFHAQNGQWVYQAGGTGGGAAFSRDGGKTFQKAKKGLVKKYGIVCAADPIKPEIWYICVGSSPMNAFSENSKVYLYRTAGGAGWKPIGWQAHPLTDTPTALTTLPGAAGHLYAGLYSGDIWHSADHGDTWQKLPFNMGGVWNSLLVLKH